MPGDVTENVNRMEPLIVEARRRGADLVQFSECGVTGYDLKNVGVNAAIPQDHPSLDRIASIARANDLMVVAGYYERAGTVLYNSATAVYPDGRRFTQRKHNIIEFEKQNTPTQPGRRDRDLFKFRGLTFAILICADSGMPGIYEELAAKRVDAVLGPTAGLGSIENGFRLKDLNTPDRRDAYFRAAETVLSLSSAALCALQLDMGSVYCNQAGWIESAGYFQPGRSSVIDRTGHLSALIPGQMLAEFLRPELALGILHGNSDADSQRFPR